MNNEDSTYKEHPDDETSLKDILYLIKETFDTLMSKWLLILFISLLCGAGLGIFTYLKEPVFNASLTFMMNEESGSSSMGGASSILGQFGFGGSGGEYNLDKIVALSKSNRIIENAILDTTNNPLLGNQIIEKYQFHEKWKDHELLKDFSFSNRGASQMERNKALSTIIAVIVGSENKKGLTTIGYSESTGIFEIETKSIDANLSLNINESIYKHLASYYIEKTTKKPKQNYDLLVNRSDSIRRELLNVESRIAGLNDSSNSLMLNKDRLKSGQLQRSAQILTIMYGEIIKNREAADFILKSKTPFFQRIDTSRLPIDQSPKGLIKMVLIGMIAGGVLSSIFVIASKVINSALSN